MPTLEKPESPIVYTIELEFVEEFYPFSDDEDAYPLPCLEQVCEVKYEPELHLKEPQLKESESLFSAKFSTWAIPKAQTHYADPPAERTKAKRTFENSLVESRARRPFFSCGKRYLYNNRTKNLASSFPCNSNSSGSFVRHRRRKRERDVIADPPFVLAFKFIRIRYRNLGDWEDWKKLFFIGFAMENGAVSSETQQGASYTYWVRDARQDAAPLPVPRKLSADDILASQASQPPTLGSVWNRAGTWEEKNLNKWASDRMKELLMSVASLEFSSGKAEIADVSKCVGDAFLVTVRNKKRVGYTYEFTLKIKGEWTIRQEKKMVKGHIDVPEFSFGELDDLQMDVRLSEEKDLLAEDKLQICQDLKRFLQPVREKLVQFEQELKER
ncbi:unnamed protein product [Citrullus colocynthis]|uniref:Activator of Hsp90 ATPase AHSA1-like N-terminal domain-containing protein n=1 Tax=Citrullus colocynthis TaxID=252529 RepID=A0ABP0Z526_9ROSI